MYEIITTIETEPFTGEYFSYYSSPFLSQSIHFMYKFMGIKTVSQAIERKVFIRKMK